MKIAKMPKRKSKYFVLPDPALGAIELEILDLDDKISHLKWKYEKLAIALINKALGEGNKYTQDQLVHGPWECPPEFSGPIIKSPTGRCVYDDRNDPCHDECLFCGEPRERK